MTEEKTTVIQKEPKKGTAHNNYRPITCLLMMWKILTAQIRKKTYDYKSSKLLTEQQKGFRKWTRGTGKLLYTDQYMIKQNETEKISYGMNWLQKGIWYGSAKLNNRVPNVQDIRRGPEVYRKYHRRLENRTESRRKKLNWSENPKRNITITISNSDDATQSHT